MSPVWQKMLVDSIVLGTAAIVILIIELFKGKPK